MNTTLRELYSEAERAGVEELGSMSLLRPTTKGMLAFIPAEDSSHQGMMNSRGINDGVFHERDHSMFHEQHNENGHGYNNNNGFTHAQHGCEQETPSCSRIRALGQEPTRLEQTPANVRGIGASFTPATPHHCSEGTSQRDSEGADGIPMSAGTPRGNSPGQPSQRVMPIIFDGPLPPQSTSSANSSAGGTTPRNMTSLGVPLIKPFSGKSGWTPRVISSSFHSQVPSQLLSARTSTHGDERRDDQVVASADGNIVSTDDEGLTKSYSTLSGHVFQELISREWKIAPELSISPSTPCRVYPLNLLLVNRTVSDELIGRVFMFFIGEQVLPSHDTLMGNENSEVKFATMLKRVAGVPVYTPKENPKYSDENRLADEHRASRARDEFLMMLHQHYCNGDGRLVAKVLAVLEFWLFGHPESKPYSIFKSKNRNKKRDGDENSEADLPPVFTGERKDSDFFDHWVAFIDQHREFNVSDGRVLRWKSTVDLYLQGFSGAVARSQDAAAEQNGVAEQNEDSNAVAGNSNGVNLHNADYHNHNVNNSGAQSSSVHNANDYAGYCNQRLGPPRGPCEIFKDLMSLQLPGLPVEDFHHLGFPYDAFHTNFRNYEEELYVFVDRYLGDEQKLNFICNEYGI